MRHVLRFSLRLPLTLALGVTGPLFAPSAARADLDSRWLPWVGCWQSAVERSAGEEQRACLVPLPDGQSVQRILVSPGDPERTSATIRALTPDNIERPATYASCPGTLRTEWSADGRRFFTTLASQCANQPMLKASGISFLLPGPVWVDIQVVQSGEDEEVQVRRYRRATIPDELSGSLPAELIAKAESASVTLAGRRLTVEQIIDASAKTTAPGIEAALLEANTRFALDRAALRALDSAHVDEHVIDLMVALTFPNHFRVDTPPSTGSADYSGAPSAAWGYNNPWACDLYWNALDSFTPCYFSSTSLINAIHYSTIGGGNIDAGGGIGSGGSLPGRPIIIAPVLPEARAINGHGYTQVRPADNPTVTPFNGSSNSTGRATASSGGSDSGASTSGGSSGGNSGASSGSSGGGYTSGGGGGDTGRTAVPR